VSDGQNGLGLGVNQSIDRRSNAMQKIAYAFSAGKSEIIMKRRPAIDQRGILRGRFGKRLGFPMAEVNFAKIGIELRRQLWDDYRRHLSAPLHWTAKAHLRRPSHDAACNRAGLCFAQRIQRNVGRADQLPDVVGRDSGMSHQEQTLVGQVANLSYPFKAVYRFLRHDRPSCNKKRPDLR
jgi:hypothetical protein